MRHSLQYLILFALITHNLAANLNIDRMRSSQLKISLTGPNIYPPAFGLLPATDQSFVKLTCQMKLLQCQSRGGVPWAVQAPRPHMYPQCVAGTWGGRAQGRMLLGCRDTYTDPLSPSYYGHNPEWHFKKNTLASLVCWQCGSMVRKTLISVSQVLPLPGILH